MTAAEKRILAKLDELVETQRELAKHFQALLSALGAVEVDETEDAPVDHLAAGFAEFADASRRKHSKERG